MHATLKSWKRDISPVLLSVLVALMPLSFSIDLRIKALPVALLFVAGLWLLISSAPTRRSYRAAAPVWLVALLLIGFVALNVLVHGLGWRPLDRPAHVVLYLVVAAVFCQPLRMRLVWVGFSLTAMALGAVCLVQHYAFGVVRAYGLNGGASASAELATVLLGLALMALVQLLGSRTTPAEKMLHGVAMVFGMVGALLTQSRGPLLAFAPMAVLVLLLHARRTRQWRLSLLLIGALGLGAGMAMFTLHGAVAERFEAIGHEVNTFDSRSDARGAVRERLEMWRTAGRAFAEYPLAGIGIDRFDDYVRGEVAAGRSNVAIEDYNQPHNEYLEAAATGGAPGLLVLLLIFALPLRYFARRAMDADESVALPACAGLAVVGLYVLCALTDSVFYRVMPQSFYFFLVLGLALHIGRQFHGRETFEHGLATPASA